MSQTVRTSLRYEGDPVKGSRFIVDVAPAADETTARQVLASTATEFSDASHHCWAWRIAQPAIDRASDDGEPSGSAGRPILAQLKGRDLVDTAVIVTRYFGGTKLGVGGLMRGYGGAAGEALDKMTFTSWISECVINFDHDYALTDAVERLVRSAEGTIVDRTFEAAVSVTVRLPDAARADLARALADLTSGTILIAPEQ